MKFDDLPKNGDLPRRTVDIPYIPFRSDRFHRSQEKPRNHQKTAALFPQQPRKSSKIIMKLQHFSLKFPPKWLLLFPAFGGKGDGELGDSKLGVGGRILAFLRGWRLMEVDGFILW